MRGYVHAAIAEAGETRRVRSSSFADHYSQARQFLISQTDVERRHIVDAFVFELSKVERPDIRERMVSNLVHVDADFAGEIAAKLGIGVPPASGTMADPVDLEPSPALSILANAPGTFAGRKLGVLVSDGADTKVLEGLRRQFERAGAIVEVIAPKVGGITDSAGTLRPADQRIDGGPSVVYDAVAVVLGAGPDAAALAQHAPALDFVRDAHAHCKFVGWTSTAGPLIDAAGLADLLDDGWVALDRPADIGRFLEAVAALRFWDREPTVFTV